MADTQNELKPSLISVDLAEWEYDTLDYLYNLEALCSSTFYNANFKLNNQDTEIPNAGARLQEVKINGMKMNWNDISSIKKYPNVKGISQGTTCTFSWVEDNYRTIETFHSKWFNNWYSREKGYFKTGVDGKFVDTDVHLYHYVLKDGVLKAEITQTLEFKGLAPTDLQEVKYSVNDNGEQVVTYVYKYMSCLKKPFGSSDGAKLEISAPQDIQDFFKKLSSSGVFAFNI